MPEVSVISHHFYGGLYCKHMIIQEGCTVVSHSHKFDHMSILSNGVVMVEADGVTEIHAAPAVIEIKAGVNHSVTPAPGYGDAVWMCLHATDCLDESLIDEVLIDKVQHMKKLDFTVDVSSVMAVLEDHPELWNEYPMRTEFAGSPHREVSDIILRYTAPELLGDLDQSRPHESVWYIAMASWASMQDIINNVLDTIGRPKLGGVLITKIPPCGQVYPHSDAGRWHSEYYNKKILVLLQSAPGQSFNYEDGELHEGITGEVFEFDNMPVHGVTNNSSIDRISLIMAVRTLPDE